MKVGDILKSSWGYEQTNVDYYQVVKTTPKQVTVRSIAKKFVTANDTQSMAGRVVPCPDEFLPEGEYGAKTLRRKVIFDGTAIRINDYSYAYVKDDFNPDYVSWYY